MIKDRIETNKQKLFNSDAGLIKNVDNKNIPLKKKNNTTKKTILILIK